MNTFPQLMRCREVLTVPDLAGTERPQGAAGGDAAQAQHGLSW